MSNKKWISIFLILIVLSLAILFYIQHFKSQGNIALIQSDGKVIKEIDLSEESSPYTFTVEEKNGGHNVILVSEGSISVIQASCPDKVCIRHGELKNSFSPIVCLPNKLTISLKSASTIDAETR